MENSECIETLCRICSAPGSHSIFSRIPAYCHDHYREYARWKQPIYMLIAEVTGIEISEHDGLPRKICELCISYLKHAYTFRRQTIDNIAGLLAAKYLSNHHRKEDKKMSKEEPLLREEIIMTAPNMVSNFTNNRSKVKQVKKPMMHRFVAKKPPNNNFEEEAELLGELDEPSSGIFGYREKEFVEDDVMDLDGLQEHGVTFTLPEDYKEKKCFACRKRFMFTETYVAHVNECLLYKLTEAIRALYQILFLKEQSAISAFEFIRRAVFTIRKSYRLVLSYDGEVDGADSGEIEDTPDGGFPLAEVLTANSDFPDLHHPELEIDSYSDSGSSDSPNGAPLPATHLLTSSMNNASQPSTIPSVRDNIARCFSVLPPMGSHSKMDIIKNRLTKTEAEEVNETGHSERMYKMIKCKKCDAQFLTISHLDEHTKKAHQPRLRT
ncbi:uncharacterized protein LOC128267876 [Anopheles cruzii]|uniref:uncharacterized protein LOC128267876 n=1 Tax=Anopheles cruzii TaxID=68878 RepID=UPI0022EC6656|nr:uncharacterized protein LOC128267876 [Anopheles cruzii]